MKVVVTGATGNVGTAVVESLAADDRVDEVVGIARRRPRFDLPGFRWLGADVSTDPLTVFAGADAVVHLAWLLQPDRDERLLRRVNVVGTRRVAEAAARHGVPRLVVASSVGTYARGPKDHPVDESWPTSGITTSLYSQQKAEVETLLDSVADRHPAMDVIRMRTSLVFSRRAAAEIERLFLGPFLPATLLGRRLLPLVPHHDRLVFQAVHSRDAGDAYRRAALDGRPGAYNVAASPVLTSEHLAEAFGARRIGVPAAVLRHGAGVTHALRLQPTSRGWVDLAFGVPVMDTTKVRNELGWSDTVPADLVVGQLLDGFARRSGADTHPLTPPDGGEMVTVDGRTAP